MIGITLAVAAGYGMFLIYTAVAFRWTAVGFGPAPRPRRRIDTAQWMKRLDLEDIRVAEFLVAVVALGTIAGAMTFAVFGGVVPALLGALFAAGAPVAGHRHRLERRRALARDVWPRMIEEVRLLTGSLGRPIPQALLEVGRKAPPELAPAFRAAEREWLITTDFSRTVAVLKDRLADATADAACETLLVAHSVGGTDVDKRLAALVDDRVQDLQGRKDALAKQAGVRFARRFVLIVPIGMALAGLSIGTGREAYATSLGQFAVVAAIGSLFSCWIWAGRLMRLPQEERVFV